MSTVQIDPSEVVKYDGPLRFLVRSRTQPHDHYAVELDAYGGNGSCACDHFTCRLGPLLARRVTPEQAVAEKLVKLKKDQDPRDSLRCWHLIEARRTYTDDTIKAVHDATEIHLDNRRQTA